MAIIAEKPPLKAGPRGCIAFLGDAERVFEVTPALVIELERVTGAGIGALCRRLFSGDFKQADVNETIRLALIGGGETPERASELVQVYVAERPISESYGLSVTILERLWFGPSDKGGNNATQE